MECRKAGRLAGVLLAITQAIGYPGRMTEPTKPTRRGRPQREDDAAAVFGVLDSKAVAARYGVTPAAVGMWLAHGHGPAKLREGYGVLNGGYVWPEDLVDEVVAERDGRTRGQDTADRPTED